MKRNRILKIIVITLLVILLSIISFGGIFVEDKKNMKNLMPEYMLSRELTGSRRVQLKVDDTVNTINYDANGNVIDENHTHPEGEEHSDDEIASTEQVPVNKERDLTAENYKKSKSILEKRLQDTGINDYTVRLNEEDGTMLFEVPEDDNTDLVVSQLSKQGDFRIIDAETEEILLTNEHLEKVGGGIQQVSTGYVVLMQFKFNSEGTEKLKEITNTYVTTEDEEGNSTEKQISLEIDGEAIVTTSFNEEISNGIIQLTIGGASTDISSEEFQSNYLSVLSDAESINSGKLPIIYTVNSNRYVASDMQGQSLDVAMYIAIGVMVVALLFIIIKYRKLGILGTIAFIGYLAVLLIVVRYANVEISIAGIVALLLSAIINYIITIIILNNFKKESNGKLAFGKATDKVLMMIIPAYIIAIVFTFANSFGMVMFWGLTVSVIYNYLITRTLLIEKK